MCRDDSQEGGFPLYKSAETHTKVKIKKPFYFWLVVVLVPLLLFLGQRILTRLSGHVAPANTGDTIHQVPPTMLVQPMSSRSSSGQILSAAEYKTLDVPRIKGQPYTALRYDAVTAVAVAPIPAVCYIVSEGGKEDCRCRTQQDTRYETTQGECRQVVHNGFFNAWGAQGVAHTVQGQSAPSVAPAVALSQNG